jgi:hypothetical protein
VHEVPGPFVQVAIGPDYILSVKVIQLATRFAEMATGWPLGSCRPETGREGQVLPFYLTFFMFIA